MLKANDRAQMRREALCDIAAMVTPKSNGTVRRMAARAREAVTFADRVRHAYVDADGHIHPVRVGSAVIDVSTFGQPGEVVIGRGVTAKGGAGGVSGWIKGAPPTSEVSK